MKPKYTTVAAIISFDDYPDNDKLMLAIQDAWFQLCETYTFIDPDSGSLSIPIETDAAKVIYIYTMTAHNNRELTLTKEE